MSIHSACDAHTEVRIMFSIMKNQKEDISLPK